MRKEVSGRMKKKIFLAMAASAALLILILALLFLYFQQPPTHACGTLTTLNSATGTSEVNTFILSDDVYVKGAGMLKNHNYTIHLINDTTIVDGMAIPANVTNTITVTTNVNGTFAPTLVWSNPLTPGYYDIIADCQEVGVTGSYDSPDAIDDIEVNDTAGFFVIPEVYLGTIAALLACFAAIAYKRKRLF